MSALLAIVVLAAVPLAGAVVPVHQRPAILEFHLVDDQDNSAQADQSSEAPPGDKLYTMRDGTHILLKRDAVATGDQITHAMVKTTQQGPIIYVRLDARGADSMLSTTRENVGHRMAVVYNGQVINAAVIRGAFGQQFQVSGLTAAEAHSLAMQLTRASN